MSTSFQPFLITLCWYRCSPIFSVVEEQCRKSPCFPQCFREKRPRVAFRFAGERQVCVLMGYDSPGQQFLAQFLEHLNSPPFSQKIGRKVPKLRLGCVLGALWCNNTSDPWNFFFFNYHSIWSSIECEARKNCPSLIPFHSQIWWAMGHPSSITCNMIPDWLGTLFSATRRWCKKNMMSHQVMCWALKQHFYFYFLKG